METINVHASSNNEIDDTHIKNNAAILKTFKHAASSNGCIFMTQALLCVFPIITYVCTIATLKYENNCKFYDDEFGLMVLVIFFSVVYYVFSTIPTTEFIVNHIDDNQVFDMSTEDFKKNLAKKHENVQSTNSFSGIICTAFIFTLTYFCLSIYMFTEWLHSDNCENITEYTLLQIINFIFQFLSLLFTIYGIVINYRIRKLIYNF